MRCSTLLASVLATAATVQAYSVKTHINYTVVTGVFKQDDAATDASSFNFTAENFGLIERGYPSDKTYHGRKPTSWQRLNHYIDTLNRKAKKTERYTLLFLGRHGEGYHNAAESYFGTPAWNCYWSEKDGNTTVTWADAHLTPTGIQQARDVNAFWKKLLTVDKIAAPQTYYTSPLYRCLDTARLTFSGLPLSKKNPFIPTVKENFREGISAHTCDRRSNKTYIRRNFPTYRFEKGFAEFDPYWQELHAEPQADQDIRSKKVLDDVFGGDQSTYISVTAHSGEIASLLRVLGHRVFSLKTGAAIPVLVKVTTLKGSGPATTTLPYAPQKTCAVPPTIRDSSCNDCSCC
ncbi:phosphoglycerate mutase-like protein, partial [Bimuria novae-zelandiae CBS 107.79]